MAEYIEIGQLWKCETCYHRGPHGCVLGGFGCDHGESYRPDYRKLKKADVAPVVHGRWVGLEYDGYADGCPVYDLWECSECGEEVRGEDVPTTHPWCHGCGARMDGGGNG